jgi:hypothetical protein
VAHHAARLGPELPLQQVASAGAHVSNAGDTQLLLQLLLHGPAHARQIPHSQLQQLLVCLQVLKSHSHKPVARPPPAYIAGVFHKMRGVWGQRHWDTYSYKCSRRAMRG